jgi:diguanylate cyclase (GGDEF)-like protein
MFDVDYFKQFNDHYGHLTGDTCLQTLSNALSQIRRRAGELVARYGGDEFVVLLPNADKHAAFETAEQIQQIVNSLAIPHEKNNPEIVTISIGIASLRPSNQHTHEELLLQADKALYRAKLAGRNCVAD